jgi:hypothetical protein
MQQHFESTANGQACWRGDNKAAAILIASLPARHPPPAETEEVFAIAAAMM